MQPSGLHLFRFCFVGVTRLELATSRPPDAYSNQLSYTPILFQKRCKGKHFFYYLQIFQQLFSTKISASIATDIVTTQLSELYTRS